MNKSVISKSTSAFDPCGIEVSARTLVVALRRGDQDEPLREFANTAEGHQGVRRFLARSGRRVHVGLESTGLYGLDLALGLHQAGVALMVANPRAVRHFAHAIQFRESIMRNGGAHLRGLIHGDFRDIAPGAIGEMRDRLDLRLADRLDQELFQRSDLQLHELRHVR